MNAQYTPSAEARTRRSIKRLAELPCHRCLGGAMGFDSPCPDCKGSHARFPWLRVDCGSCHGQGTIHIDEVIPHGHCYLCHGKRWVPNYDVGLGDAIKELKAAEVHIKYLPGAKHPWAVRLRLIGTVPDVLCTATSLDGAFWLALDHTAKY